MGMTSGTRLRVTAALLLAATLAASGVARADWDDRVDPSDYEEELAPHGAWVADAQFGRVWRPSVWWEWRPYVDGHWIWTSYGWTWVSAEPWAWTFHYGRWGFSNAYGWVWTPGVVWGPAWVDWFWGDGFVGWVPLGPPGFPIVPGYWNYVHDHQFCAPRVTTVLLQERLVPHHIIEHRAQGWGRSHAPPLHDIELVSRHTVVRQSDRPRDSIAPWVQRRVERGEGVHERVVEQGHERVIDHAPRPVARPENAGRPPVADDGGWRRGEHGVVERQAPSPGTPAAPRRGTVDVPPVTGPGNEPGRPYVIERHGGRWEASGGGERRHERPHDVPGPSRPAAPRPQNLPIAPESFGHAPTHPGTRPIAPPAHGGWAPTAPTDHPGGGGTPMQHATP